MFFKTIHIYHLDIVKANQFSLWKSATSVNSSTVGKPTSGKP